MSNDLMGMVVGWLSVRMPYVKVPCAIKWDKVTASVSQLPPPRVYSATSKLQLRLFISALLMLNPVSYCKCNDPLECIRQLHSLYRRWKRRQIKQTSALLVPPLEIILIFRDFLSDVETAVFRTTCRPLYLLEQRLLSTWGS